MKEVSPLVEALVLSFLPSNTIWRHAPHAGNSRCGRPASASTGGAFNPHCVSVHALFTPCSQSGPASHLPTGDWHPERYVLKSIDELPLGIDARVPQGSEQSFARYTAASGGGSQGRDGRARSRGL